MSSAVPTPAAAHAGAARPTASHLVSVHRLAAYKRLGKVLAAMKPEDAAKVVTYMRDDEVVGILTQLSPKDAAALLTAIPQERAGQLGRELLTAVAVADSTAGRE